MHAVAFESKEDAERFCWFMRTTAPEGSKEGVCTTRPMPPKTLEAMADERAYGVTVVGAGRIDLGPNRIDVELLQDMIRAATNAALAKIKSNFDQKLSSVTGGVGVPGLF